MRRPTVENVSSANQRTHFHDLAQRQITLLTTNFLVLGSTNIKKLQRLQNTAARIVLPDLSKLPSTSLLRELHWLSVHSRIIYKLACLTYNSLTTGQPSFFNQLLHPSRTLRSTNQLLLDCPRFSTEFGKRSFSYLASSLE